MADFIRREDAIEIAVNAFNAWNLAMAAADGTREINLVFKRKELCKAVELIFRGAPATDVVQVVRCKGCRFGSYDSEVNGAMVCEHWKDGCWRQEDDFCSHGMAR